MRCTWLGTVLAAVLSAGACSAMGGFDQAKEDFHYSYPFAAGGHLHLEDANGSVQITGWDQNTIDISGTKYAPTQEELSQVKVKTHVQGADAVIETEFPRHLFHGGSYGVSYVIHVPRHTALEHVETSNGSVSAGDLEGGGRIESSNGRISVSHATGDYKVSTSNGSIDLDQCRGDFRAESNNGSIKGELASGAVSANTVNGSVNFTINDPHAGQPIHLSSTNGSVVLALVSFHGNPIKAETTNGSVTLRLPSGVNADLNASTVMAGIHSDLPVVTTGEASKHHLSGKLGNGGPLIVAETTTGSVHLQHY